MSTFRERIRQFINEEEGDHDTPIMMRHCVRKVAKKDGNSVSDAFAICTANFQDNGYIKKDSQELTQKGKKQNQKHKDEPEDEKEKKDREYEELLRKAREKRAEESTKGKVDRLIDDHMRQFGRMVDGAGASEEPVRESRQDVVDVHMRKHRRLMDRFGDGEDDVEEAKVAGGRRYTRKADLLAQGLAAEFDGDLLDTGGDYLLVVELPDTDPEVAVSWLEDEQGFYLTEDHPSGIQVMEHRKMDSVIVRVQPERRQTVVEYHLEG